MCRKLKGCGRKIDPCMHEIIRCLQEQGVKTLACCCGHGKYPMTIIIDAGREEGKVIPQEIFSGIYIHRKKRFYIKTKAGHYVIPESIGGGT